MKTERKVSCTTEFVSSSTSSSTFVTPILGIKKEEEDEGVVEEPPMVVSNSSAATARLKKEEPEETEDDTAHCTVKKEEEEVEEYYQNDITTTTATTIPSSSAAAAAAAAAAAMVPDPVSSSINSSKSSCPGDKEEKQKDAEKVEQSVETNTCTCHATVVPSSSVVPGVRKGQWTDQEDSIVIDAVTNSSEQPFTRWSDLAQQLPGRVGKQLRDRWVNQLNPNINHLPFSREEDLLLWEGHTKLGNKWVEISTKSFHSTRSENRIKNRWHSASFQKKISNEFGTKDAAADGMMNNKNSSNNNNNKRRKRPYKKRATTETKRGQYQKRKCNAALATTADITMAEKKNDRIRRRQASGQAVQRER